MISADQMVRYSLDPEHEVLCFVSERPPGDEEQELCYDPQKALTLALTDWLQEFLSADQPGGSSR